MKIGGWTAALGASLLLWGVTPAMAATDVGTTPAALQSYRFIGQCEDCYDGAGNGTATLVLHDYTDGDMVSDQNFVSFTYDGTDLLNAFTITAADEPFLVGGMAGPYPSTERFTIQGGQQMFQTFTGGFWCVGGSCLADYGFSHSWTALAASTSALPEASTWAMMIVGFGVMGAAARRRRGQGHAPARA